MAVWSGLLRQAMVQEQSERLQRQVPLIDRTGGGAFWAACIDWTLRRACSCSGQDIVEESARAAAQASAAAAAATSSVPSEAPAAAAPPPPPVAPALGRGGGSGILERSPSSGAVVGRCAPHLRVISMATGILI
jgi:hypothetical protein